MELTHVFLEFQYETVVYRGWTRCPVAGNRSISENRSVAGDRCPVAGSDGSGKPITVTTSQLRLCQTNFNRQAVIHNVLHNVWARIGRSKTAGIGVIAVRDIPRGQDPFSLPDGQACAHLNALRDFSGLNVPGLSCW